MNYRLLYKVIGSLLFLLGALLAACIALTVYYHEDDMAAFLISAILTFSTGFVLKYLGRDADNNLSRRDAYLLVTATWVVFSFFGMLPFLIGGYIPNVTDAFFETMSGFTTTGATILTNIDALPHTILYWRSLTQWIGGLGIVFFTIAILPSMVGSGSGSVKVFAAEATGPMRAKMHPRLSTMAKWIWTVYLALTIGCILSFCLCGMGWFDSINYALTTTATGGFAPHSDAAYLEQNPAFSVRGATYVSALFQFLAGINFAMLYMAVIKFRVRALFRSSEFKVYFAIVLLSTVFIAWLLVRSNGYGYEHAFRTSLFHVVSVMTTTGIFVDDLSRWPHITWVVLGSLMFLGACAGSTTGGFKTIRGIMVFKVLRNEFRKSLHPNAVLPVKVNGQAIPQQKLSALLAFFAIYTIMLVLTATIMITAGIDNTNAITIALSCMSNVGATLDTGIGTVMSWADLSVPLKWACTFLMLVGRLEIMSVLILFTPTFWKDN